MKNILYIMCGLPGSGKSTAAEVLDGVIVSSDTVREELYGDASIQGNGKEVFKRVDELVNDFLKSGNVIYDATSLTPSIRKRIINKFKDAEPIAVWVDTPLEECLCRNENRERIVPAEVIRNMNKRFIIPSLEEGFSKIIRIRS